MVNRNKELAINTVILGFGQLIPKVLAVILLPLLTSYLTVDEYGNYDLILSVANLLIPISTMQIQQAIFRFLLATIDKKERSKYITSSLCYILMSSSLLYPFVCLVLISLGTPVLTALLICVLFFSESTYSLLGQIVRGIGYNIKYSKSVIIYSAVNLAATALLLIKFQTGLPGVLISLAIGYLSADIYMIISTKMYEFFNFRLFSVPSLRDMLKFSIPIVPSSIALWIVNLSDRLIIINFLGAAANGIYAVANKIPSLYSTAYNVFNLAWTETASRVSDDGNPEIYYTKLFSILFRFLIGIMLILIAITPVVFSLLVNRTYDSAFFQVPILYFGIFFNSLVNYYSGIYIALKRTRQVGYSSIIGAIINTLFNLFFINSLGLYAASISTALSFMLIVLYRAYDLNKVISIKYNKNEIIIGMILFIVSACILYSRNRISTIVTVIIAIIYNIVYNLKYIKSIIGKIYTK